MVVVLPGAMAPLAAAGLDLAVMEMGRWAERIRQDVHSKRLKFGMNVACSVSHLGYFSSACPGCNDFVLISIVPSTVLVRAPLPN